MKNIQARKARAGERGATVNNNFPSALSLSEMFTWTFFVNIDYRNRQLFPSEEGKKAGVDSSAGRQLSDL